MNYNFNTNTFALTPQELFRLHEVEPWTIDPSPAVYDYIGNVFMLSPDELFDVLDVEPGTPTQTVLEYLETFYEIETMITINPNRKE